MCAWKQPKRTLLSQDFYRFHSVEVTNEKVMIAAFSGEAAATHELIHVFSVMDKALEELLDSEHPTGIILDFRGLKYEWGDEMARTLSVPSILMERDFPVAVITSELNREGLMSLVRDEMMCKPADWLTDSKEAAIALLKKKFRT